MLKIIRYFSNDTKVVMTPLQLYKHLLRQCEKLPPDACKHYKFAVKQVIKMLNFDKTSICCVSAKFEEPAYLL